MNANLEKTEIDTLLVDPSEGMSGDMFLGSIFELGADPENVRRIVAKLPGLEPFRIITERVISRGITTRRTRVVCDSEPSARNFSDILSMINDSNIDPSIKSPAVDIFKIIAESEGKVHDKEPLEVHFHEVGAVDSIVDIVGSVAGLYLLGFPKIYRRRFRLGSGSISIAHGVLPVPAPATLEILKGEEVEMTERDAEIVTPSGAAILKVLGEPLSPSLPVILKRVVYSSGTREYKGGPGLLRVIEIGETAGSSEITVIRTTIDDMNPEILQYLREKLFELGALEVYFTPVMMKKGRPGTKVTVLSLQDAAEEIFQAVFKETTTFGIRITSEKRIELDRWIESVNTAFGRIKIKFRKFPDGSVDFTPEYESCKEAALARKVPLEKVYREARESGSERLKRAEQEREDR
ncbi:MAG TPA: nickel pincer cofactor biosynthesis protein LarC [Candidatus Krumholzibacteriaceae bacterium]|nr:nickel pincer cofactor biosynthesis protein LarC [Candidatus Krumholzibacteriaceae bacterium]